MSYVKTEWATGDVITAQKLNNMENGIEAVDEYAEIFTADVSESVGNWLDDHPEATTTVEDNAITTAKLQDGAVTTPKLANGSVTDDKLASDGIKAEVSDLKTDLGFNFYASPISSQTLGSHIDMASVTIQENKIINLDGTIVEYSGYNIASFQADPSKGYYIRYRTASKYNEMVGIQLVKNGSVIGSQKPTNNQYEYAKIHDFDGTIRVCYRAVDSTCFLCYYYLTPTQKGLSDAQVNIAELTAEIGDIFEVGKNLYNKEENTLGKYISWNTGGENTNVAYTISGYIPLEAGKKYTINKPEQTCIYNANKQFVGGFFIVTNSSGTTVYQSESFPTQSTWLKNYTNMTSPITIEAQEGWAYMRINVPLSVFNIFMIENSDSLTDFEPYQLIKPNFSADASLLRNLNSVLINRTFAKVVKEPLQIKLIGDSLTAGAGGTGYDQSQAGGGELIADYGGGVYSNVEGHCWANSLKAYWEEKFNCTVKNFGWSGIASNYILTYWNQLIKDADDIIVCMIGTNDRADQTSLDGFISNLEAIYLKAYQAQKPIVFMASIPASVANEDNGTKHFHMEDVEHAIRYVTDKYNIPFVNLYQMFLDYCSSHGVTIDSLLADGLHPNDDGYDAMFELISRAFGISPKRPNADW